MLIFMMMMIKASIMQLVNNHYKLHYMRCYLRYYLRYYSVSVLSS